MILKPDIHNWQGGGWHIIADIRSNGRGEVKVVWEPVGQHDPEFAAGLNSPAAALEVVLGRVERIGVVSPLDVPAILGVLIGHFQRRAA